jgi:ribonuclease HI
VKLSQLDSSEGIAIYTDGSAWSVDKSGGWAWLAMDAFGGLCSASGFDSGVTSNIMEMVAWISGLNSLFDALGPCRVIVFSDSEYVGLGAMDRTRNRRVNRKLWRRLDTAIDKHLYVEFAHVKGHSNHMLNDEVDRLAGLARRQGQK